MSGGKDTYTLLHLLMRLRERAPIDFELVAVNLDQGQPGYPAEVVERHSGPLGVPYRMLQRDTYSVVRRLVPEGRPPARCARGSAAASSTTPPSRWAARRSRSDIIATTSWRRSCSPRSTRERSRACRPKLRSDDGRNVVIRPLCYAAEEDIAAFAAAMRFPIIPCDLCGSQPNLRRKRVKALPRELTAEHRAVKGNLLNALGHVVPSHLLDRDLQPAAASPGRDPWLDRTRRRTAAAATPRSRPPSEARRRGEGA